MSQPAERLQLRQRQPGSASTRRRAIQVQTPSATLQLRSRGSAPAAARAAAPVSEAVHKRTSEPVASGPAALPARLRAGVEALSGLAMDDVQVHRNSPEPARLGALAYTKGTDIHLGPGQEQHLPHEAWHVIQQKQGRVKATTQMKGLIVNEEARLEAEADEMAARIGASSPIDAKREARRQVPSAAVIQRKIIYKGAPLSYAKSAKFPPLDTINSLPPVFVLRDDWEERFPHYNIHLLDNTRKYILGERHDQTKWRDDVSNWTYVRKMREGDTELPEDGDRFINASPLADLPLESTHAFLMQACIHFNSVLNHFCSPNRPRSWDLYKPDREHTPWISVIFDQADLYRKFVSVITVTPKPSPVRLLIHKFAERLQRSYLPLLRNLASSYAKILLILARPGFKDTQETRYELLPYFTAVNVTRKVFPLMVDDLREILGIAKNSPEGRFIASQSAPAKAYDSRSIRAGRPARERAMAKNLNAVAPPLLVQLGDAHVEGVGDHVPSAVKVRRGQRLEAFTSFDANDGWRPLRSMILYRGAAPKLPP